ncbi:pyridoxal phosphate-dependent aminotransferase [Afifella aestuarii]|uniref:pyridoxal phosphate-dependent aminotransferase n=1 Tax=Afifella aestuarii TaxID=1909496 RepID=UPI000FE335A6|nr:pyridoxal phosphate-dependent aminotransferase [Afifella aestuarii]
MNKISSRMAAVLPSASSAASARARELKAAGRDIINLSVGEPDFDTPEHIVRAASAAMASGKTRYTNVDGTPELKAAVIRKFKDENGLDFAANQIVVGTGAKQVIFNVLLATLDAGDEVIIPAPHWVSYPDMVRIAEGTPVVVECRAEDGFKLSAETLKAAITEKTRWLVLNSPCNPTGAVYGEADLRALADVLLDHPQVGVLSDDIYEHIVFGETSFRSIAAVEPRLLERTVAVNGVSKAYCMTGWRLGYGGGPAEVMREVRKLQSQSTSCASSISQAGALAALEGPQDHLESHRTVYRRRRDLVLPKLVEAGLTCEAPDGAFYILAGCQKFLGMTSAAGTKIETDADFTRVILEEGEVAMVPGSAFGAPGYVRLSFAVDDDRLMEAASRIARTCAALRS